jgi:hypothetical protein
LPVTTVFQFAGGEWNPAFDVGANCEIGKYVAAWNIVPGGMVPAGSDPYIVISSDITSFNAPFIIGNAGAILAVENSIDCSVQYTADQIELNWTTNELSEYSYFDIEEQKPGESFRKIARVPASASGNRNREFVCQHPGGSPLQYRIRGVMADGRSLYSNTVAVIIRRENGWLNPLSSGAVADRLQVQLVTKGRETLDLVFFDSQGRTIKKQVVSTVPGNNLVTVQLSGLGGGLYYLVGVAENGLKTNIVRFIKQ